MSSAHRASPQHPQSFPPISERLRAGNPARRVDPPAGWRSFSKDIGPSYKSLLAGFDEIETRVPPGHGTVDLERHDLVRARQRPGADVHRHRVEGAQVPLPRQEG